MTKDITPTRYANLYGCEPQYIHKLLKDGASLPHVKKVKRYGRFYLLEVSKTLSKKSFKKKAA